MPSGRTPDREAAWNKRLLLLARAMLTTAGCADRVRSRDRRSTPISKASSAVNRGSVSACSCLRISANCHTVSRTAINAPRAVVHRGAPLSAQHLTWLRSNCNRALLNATIGAELNSYALAGSWSAHQLDSAHRNIDKLADTGSAAAMPESFDASGPICACVVERVDHNSLCHRRDTLLRCPQSFHFMSMLLCFMSKYGHPEGRGIP